MFLKNEMDPSMIALITSQTVTFVLLVVSECLGISDNTQYKALCTLIIGLVNQILLMMYPSKPVNNINNV